MMKKGLIKTIDDILKMTVVTRRDDEEERTTLEKILKRYLHMVYLLASVDESESIFDSYMEQKMNLQQFGDVFKIKRFYKSINDIFYKQCNEIEEQLICIMESILTSGNAEMQSLILNKNRHYLNKSENKREVLRKVIKLSLQEFSETCTLNDANVYLIFMQNVIHIFTIINNRLDNMRAATE